MIETVIVPLDGSDLAEKALPFGRSIAEKTGAQLHLLRVLAPDTPAAGEDEARDYLRARAREINDRVQFSLRLGNSADEIIDGAEEMPHALIVMTTHGRGGIGRWLYGSVADRVVRGTGLPVLLLRSKAIPEDPSRFRRIMVPLDGSIYADAALPYAEHLAQSFGATLQIVRVAETTQLYTMMSREPMVEADVAVLDQMSDQLVQEARQYLDRLAERLRGQDLTVEAQVLEGFPGDQLLAFEREHDIDLVVMSTRGRAGLGRLVFGSVAERMLKSGTTPVLMIKPEGEIANGEAR